MAQSCKLSLELQARSRVSCIGTKYIHVEYHEFFGCYDYNFHEFGIKMNVVCYSGNSMPKESALSLVLVEEIV